MKSNPAAATYGFSSDEIGLIVGQWRGMSERIGDCVGKLTDHKDRASALRKTIDGLDQRLAAHLQRLAVHNGGGDSHKASD